MQVLSLGQEDPLGRAWQPTPAFVPGESLGQRSLVGYLLQGQKSQTRLKQLNTHFNLIFNIDLALLSTIFTFFLDIINKLMNE